MTSSSSNDPSATSRRPRQTRAQSERSRRFVLLLFLIASLLLVLVLSPYAGAFFAAAVLAAVAQPVQHWLTERVGGRASLAAGLLTISLVLLVVLPIGVTTALVVREGAKVARWVSATFDRSGIDGLLEPLPAPLERMAHRAVEALPAGLLPGTDADQEAEAQEAPTEADATTESAGEALTEAPQEDGADVAAPVEQGGESGGDVVPNLGSAALFAGNAISSVMNLLINSGLLVIAIYFLLAQGRQLVDYITDLLPLEPKRSRELLSSFRAVAVGVFLSTLATAGAQTLVALIGYLIVGLPALPLVLAATLIFSFVPAIGGSSVATLAGIFIWTSGRTGAGIFLTIWGLLAVSMVDNVVKPFIAKKSAQLPASLVFFAMICGLAVFGPMGLVAGPLAVAFFQVSARMLREDQSKQSASDAESSEPRVAREVK